MRIVALILSIIFYNAGDINSQNKLMFGDTSECLIFLQGIDIDHDVVEIGKGGISGTLVYPERKDITNFLKNKIEIIHPEDYVLIIHLDCKGQIECIYLAKGKLDEQALNIASIIKKEFRFKAGKNRHKLISSNYTINFSVK